MDPGKRREASRAFGDALRAKVAASREGLRLEDLMGRKSGEGSVAKPDQGREAEEEDRR